MNLLGVNDENSFLAASHIGRGVGIAQTLKQFSSMIRMHYNYIPHEIMDKYNCQPLTLWDRHGMVSDEFYDCILE